MSTILYPYAIELGSNKIVTPLEVENGKECNCICFHCKENLIAINNPTNKQKPHFRHDPNTNCEANFESYLHWLSKEVFKKIDGFYLPKIDLERIEQKIISTLLPLFNIHKTPKKLRELIVGDIIKNITEVEKVLIQRVEIEETFNSPIGNIRVDIVLRFTNKKGEERILFIEPFLTNQIDTQKLSKLRNINISTISINLQNFIAKKSRFFKLSELRAFLVNDINSKKWEYFSLERILSNQKIELIKQRIASNENQIKDFERKKGEINSVYREINELEKSQKIIQEKIANLKSEVRKKYDGIDLIKFS